MTCTKSWRDEHWKDDEAPDRMRQAREFASGDTPLTADDLQHVVGYLLGELAHRDETIASLKHSRAEVLKDPAEQAKVVERLLDDIRRPTEPDVMSEVLESIFPPENGS